LPPTNQEALDAVNWERVRMDPPLPAVTSAQVWLHFGHRVGAVVVSALVLLLASAVLRRYRMRPRLARPAVLLVVLLLAQLTLGVLTVLLRKPADVASAHVAVGALVLVTAFVLTVRAIRVFGTAGPQEIVDGLPADAGSLATA
jgi:cytochrome c oxidase assembly protein subunit 15